MCGNPVQAVQIKPFLDELSVPSCSLREGKWQKLENIGNTGNALTERYPQEKGSKLDSRKEESLHSAVGNFLSLLGIPQYADQFIDLGLESLVTLSRLGHDVVICRDLFGKVKPFGHFQPSACFSQMRLSRLSDEGLVKETERISFLPGSTLSI